jgi:hypothetical protein
LFWRGVVAGTHVLPWDFRDFHLPMAELQAHCLRTGQWPLWDPFSYFGRPLVANIQAQTFYPPRWIALVVNHLTGGEHLLYLLELLAIAHVVLAGLFARRMLERLGAPPAAATAGSIVYQLGGFFASQAQHLGVVCGGAWLPLAWLAVLELKDRISRRWVAILALALAMAILAGLPSLAAGIFASTWVLTAAVMMSHGAVLRTGLAVARASLAALLLAAVQLLPAIELNFHSIAQYRAEWRPTGGGIPLQALVSMVAPNHYGIFDLSTYRGPWEPTFMYLYCSLGGLVLALAALVQGRRPETRLFGVLTLLFALAMLGDQTPIGRWGYQALPAAVRAAVQPEFLMPNFILGVAVLCGLGAAQMLKRKALAWAAVAVIAADLILVGSGRPMNGVAIAFEPGVTRYAFDGSEELLARLRLFVNQAVPPHRIDLADDTHRWGMTAPLTRIPTGTGYDPMAPARVIRLRLAFARGQHWGATYPVENLASPAVDLAGIRYVLSRAPIPAETLAAARFRHVADLPGRRLYENLEALPRFYLVGKIRRAASLEEAAAMLLNPAFDSRTEAVVEGGDMPAGAASGSVRVLSYRENRIVLEVTAEEPAFLVTSETHYPGWKAWIDQVEQPILYTNVAFRGLPVPSGRHRVVLAFEPVLPAVGAALSTLGLFLLLFPRPGRAHLPGPQRPS